jgi:phosphoribosyl-ATP pyrophosphohydrolase/phosphoribosyl-AMP cyclohydrolase
MITGKMAAQRFAARLKYGKEGLLPVVAVDSLTREVLMLAYADRQAVEKTLTTGFAWFFSRDRKKLWKKGETSGNIMEIAAVKSDCDSDALIYEVEMQGDKYACHMGRKSCFKYAFGGRKARFTLAELAEVIDERAKEMPKGSYTARLVCDRELACAKIEEEAAELVEALQKKNRKEVAWEACDLIFHALAAARGREVGLSGLEAELARRRKANKR